MGAETGPCAVRESKGEEVTMATFPEGVHVFREKENLPGVVFDPNNKKTLYANDMIALEEEVRAVEATLLTPAGRRMPIVGTGFPNGVVTAPVGATYIDTNATNGAVEWKKATGTGNTGWVVSVGDTGDRDISSLLLNGWTAASGRITMRRIGSRVSITAANGAGISGVAATADVFMDIPAGFETRRQAFHDYDVLGTGHINFGGGSATVISRRFDSIATASRKAMFGFNLEYVTAADWPTTLPGTAN